MPEPLTTYIGNWRNLYQLIGSDLWQLASALKGAATWIEAENWGFAALFLDSAGDDCQVISRQFSIDADSLYFKAWDALSYIDDNIGGGGGVTMDGILSAMIGAEFEQLQKFVGITDAYKVAIWNAPFNQEFYAALARGFAQWQQS